MTKTGEAGPAKFKRFFDAVSVENRDGAFAIFLDGRPAKTRGRSLLAARTKLLAEAVAEEWRGESEFITPKELPLTQMLMKSIDQGGRDRDKWAQLIVSFLDSDMLCYGAASPQALVDRQRLTWAPFIDWARETLGLDLIQTVGVTFVEQRPETASRGAALLAGCSAETLLSLRMITELTGSAVLAFAVWKKAFRADEIFSASRIDEQFQREHWGEDAEASAREALVKRDFDVARRFLDLASA